MLVEHRHPKAMKEWWVCKKICLCLNLCVFDILRTVVLIHLFIWFAFSVGKASGSPKMPMNQRHHRRRRPIADDSTKSWVYFSSFSDHLPSCSWRRSSILLQKRQALSVLPNSGSIMSVLNVPIDLKVVDLLAIHWAGARTTLSASMHDAATFLFFSSQLSAILRSPSRLGQEPMQYVEWRETKGEWVCCWVVRRPHSRTPSPFHSKSLSAFFCVRRTQWRM